MSSIFKNYVANEPYTGKLYLGEIPSSPPSLDFGCSQPLILHVKTYNMYKSTSVLNYIFFDIL